MFDPERSGAYNDVDWASAFVGATGGKKDRGFCGGEKVGAPEIFSGCAREESGVENGRAEIGDLRKGRLNRGGNGENGKIVTGYGKEFQ